MLHLLDISPATWVFNSIISTLVLAIVYLNGALRLCFCAQQVCELYVDIAQKLKERGL